MLRKIALLFVFFSFISQFNFGQNSNYKLLIFEGSDWCANCIQFDKTVNSSDAFVAFIDKESMSIEHVDFPQRKTLDEATKKYNAEMAEKYNFKGSFPTILLINTSDNSYQELRYANQTPDEFIELIKSKTTDSR